MYETVMWQNERDQLATDIGTIVMVIIYVHVYNWYTDIVRK